MLFSALFSVAILAAVSVSSPVKRDYPAFYFPDQPAWSRDVSDYANALVCPLGLPSAAQPPVLLIHGTMASGADTWPGSYVPALESDGYRACYLELPFRAGVDMQVSAEYIAYNLHYLSYLSGGEQVALISHSQGGPDTQWALAWFPSARSVTSMFLPLCPDLLGVTYAALEFNTICPAYECQPSIWQQMLGSRFTQALRVHDFEALVPATLLWTATDEIVTPPNTNALLSGGTTIGVQDLCPNRVIDHVYIVVDAAAYAIMQDALRNNGTASLGRVAANNPDVCSELVAKNMNVSAVPAITYASNGAVDGFVLGPDRVPSEPPLMPYVYGSNANS